jgi:aspartate/methionine/tyrosine aminotransferase
VRISEYPDLEPVPSRAVEETLENHPDRLRLGGYFWLPAGPPRHIEDVAARALRNHHGQVGAAGLPSLRDALVDEARRRLGVCVSASEITVTPGAMAGIHAICCALLAPGDEVITIAPDYPIAGSVRLAGGRLVRVRPSRPSGSGVGDAVRQIGSRTRALYLSNPRNPSGGLLNDEDMSCLANALELNSNVVLIVDEAYERMCHVRGSLVSAWSVEALRDRTVVVRSFSKSYALPGLRLGWILAAEWVTSRLRRVLEWQQLYGSVVTQTIALQAVVGDQDWLDDMAVCLTTSRNLMVRRLRQIVGLKFQVPLAGPFVYVDTTALSASSQLSAGALVSAGLSALPGEAFGDLSGHIRIPFSGPRVDVERACTLIEQMCGLHRA